MNECIYQKVLMYHNITHYLYFRWLYKDEIISIGYGGGAATASRGKLAAASGRSSKSGGGVDIQKGTLVFSQTLKGSGGLSAGPNAYGGGSGSSSSSSSGPSAHPTTQGNGSGNLFLI